MDEHMIAEVVAQSACPGCESTRMRALAAATERRIFVTDGTEMAARIGVSCCSDCGLIFLNPRLSAEALRAYYAKQSRMPRGTVSSDSPLRQMTALQITLITGHKALGSSSKALEIGCAEGYFLEDLGQRIPGIQLVGLEPSGRYANAARERLPQAQIHEVFLDQMGFAHGEFDLIVVRHVLEHLPEPVQALKSLRPLLAPNGAIYIEVPNTARIVPAMCHFFQYEHLTYFTQETMGGCLARAGFLPKLIEAHEGYAAGSGFSYPVLRVMSEAADIGLPRNFPDQPERIWNAFLQDDAAFVSAVLAPLKQRLDQHADRGRRLGLFGAGPHTMDLLDRLSPTRYPWRVVFDNNQNKAGKSLMGIPISLPTAETLSSVDAILVSSAEFEAEMVMQARSLVGNQVEIIPIYGKYASL